MEVLHIAPYKVLHLEYNEVKVLARLQKAIGESHTLMCCCFCRKLTLLFCTRVAQKSPTPPFLSFATLFLWEWLLCDSRDSSAPPCLFMLHIQLLSLCSHPLQWVHDEVPDFAFRLRHLRLRRRFAEICSRITPDECLGQPLRYLLHLLKNSSMRKGGLSAHFVCCRFEAAVKCLSVSMNLLLKSSELAFYLSAFYLLSVNFLWHSGITCTGLPWIAIALNVGWMRNVTATLYGNILGLYVSLCYWNHQLVSWNNLLCNENSLS